MIIKYEEYLQLQQSTEPISAIEVDIDALEALDEDFSTVLSNALALFSEDNKDACTSVYTLLSPSYNFKEVTYSGFIGVLGDEKLLDFLMQSFSSIKGTRIRQSEPLDARQSTLEYHLENGLVWIKNIPGTWWAKNTEESDETDEPSSKPTEATRYRAARSDATVATIKAQIEAVFGLPEGSVALLSPDGSKIKSNAKIATLRNRWEY